MTTSALATLVVVISALMLPVAWRALRTAIAHRDWDSTSTLVFFAGLTGNLPTALSQLVSPSQPTYNAFGILEVGLTGWALRLEQLTALALLAGSVVFFSLRFTRERYLLAPFIALAIALAGDLSDLIHAQAGAFSPRELTLLALLLAATVARPGRSAYLGAAAVGILFALLGGLQALLHPDDVFRVCRTDKCSAAGGLYVGAFTNENVLGLLLAVTIVFVWLAVRGRSRILLTGYLVASVYLTGSRTSQAAAIAAIVVLPMLGPVLRDDPGMLQPPGRRGQRHLAVAAVVIAALAGMVLPLLPLAPTALSSRAYFWQLARAGIAHSPFIGYGSTAWANLYQVQLIPIAGTYSTHNQWVDISYAAGLIGLVLLICLVICLLVQAGPYLIVVSSVLIPIFVASAAERPWSFGINDGMTFVLLAVVLSPVGAYRSVAEDRPAPSYIPAGISQGRLAWFIPYFARRSRVSGWVGWWPGR
jgi:O-Antigen ligase